MPGAPPRAAGCPQVSDSARFRRPFRLAIVLSGFQPRMAKPTSQERRKQALRQRRADEQREYDRRDAGHLFNDAIRANRSGDIPAADRFLKKALILDPTHVGAMELLAQIHQAAGHDAEALGYLQRLRRVDTNPRAIYNIAVLLHQLGQSEKAFETVREFLSAIEGR